MSEIRELIDRQAGLVARRQLSPLGIHWHDIEHQIEAGRAVARTPRVISTFTGDLSPAQRRWLAVLHAGERSMLGGLTAAQELGLARWEREEITVLVDDELAFEPVDGVRFFRSRRSFEMLAAPGRDGVPCCRLEPAVLMWAGYDASPRAAHAVVAASVQQRLTTAGEMLAWIDRLKPLRRAPALRATLRDVMGGSESGAELDVLRLCRDHAIAPPERQVGRRDRGGRRRWTDCEWTRGDGSVLVLEVDGGFHMHVEHWSNDLRRARRLTTRDRMVVRCTAYEVRHEPGEVARDLIALGVPRL